MLIFMIEFPALVTKNYYIDKGLQDLIMCTLCQLLFEITKNKLHPLRRILFYFLISVTVSLSH